MSWFPLSERTGEIMKPTIVTSLVATAIALVSAPCQAAAMISFTLPNLVQLTGLNDVVFTNVSLATDAVNAQNVCVWSNLVSRGYTVTATGTDGVFKLTDAMSATKTAEYTVKWAEGGGAQSGTLLSPGQRSAVFVSGAGSRTCSGGTSALSTLLITIPLANLQNMTGGRTYTGTLTLVISPA